VCLDAVRDPVQDLRALLRRRLAPRREPLARCLDGGVDLGGTGPRDLGDRSFVDRRDVGERGRGTQTSATDEMLRGDLDPLDDRALRGALPTLGGASRAGVVRTRTVCRAPEPVKPSGTGGNRDGYATRLSVNRRRRSTS
jgi:hypothetical protein